MLRVLGSKKRFCDGITRRDLLQVGALGPLGIGLNALSGSALAADGGRSPVVASGFGSAKRCILLYLWGSPSQLDTLDPKPNAPVEIRGEFGSIATRLPGYRLGEILPLTAQILDQVTVLRSLTHPYPVHGMAFATSAVPTTDIPLEGRPRDSRHWPFVGSIVDFLASQKDASPPPVPRNFGLPFPFGSKRGPSRSGPYGGFLGPAYDTVWSEFRAKGIREEKRDSGDPKQPKPMVADPYLGVRPSDRFEMSGPGSTVTLDFLQGRMSLLDQFDAARRALDVQGSDSSFERQRQLARSVLASGKLIEAIDVQREPLKLRERYGMNLFGQSCLAARRVLEAGGKFVTVCWDEYGLVNTGWDTHVFMKTRLKDELGPGLDRGFTSLLMDLEERGMLADTAIVVLSEHGRTPRIQNVAGGGRDHWSRAYSAMFAGAGFARGRVVGKTDKIGGDVAENAFSPKDVVATLLHVLGHSPDMEIHDRIGRPYPLGGQGRVRGELLG